MESTQRIYAADLAKLLGKSPLTARRMLIELEEKHGAAVVRRDGRERHTTMAALERVNALGGQGRTSYDEHKVISLLRRMLSETSALAAHVRELDERVTDLSVRFARVHV